MRFYDTPHCKSRIHCKRCRDLEGGRAWRRQIVAVFGANDDADFRCPVRKPWIKSQSRNGLSFFASLYKEIMAEDPSKWMTAMANQCKQMYDNPPKGITCKSRKDYRDRWFKKLKYYRQESIQRLEIIK